MNVDNFTLNVLGASVVSQDTRTDDLGNKIERIVFDNGFTWVYTLNKSGTYSKMDFSHELDRNGDIFTPDLNNPKKDFNDYY